MRNVRIWKESNQARGTHKLEIAKGKHVRTRKESDRANALTV